MQLFQVLYHPHLEWNALQYESQCFNDNYKHYTITIIRLSDFDNDIDDFNADAISKREQIKWMAVGKSSNIYERETETKMNLFIKMSIKWNIVNKLL